MNTRLYWDAFAEKTIRQLIRARPGESLLIIEDSSADQSLAEACLAAGLRAGVDARLLIKPSRRRQKVETLDPIVSAAIRASKYILDLTDEIDTDPATQEARKHGSRLLITKVNGVEEYVIRALLDVDYEGMMANAKLVAGLWEQTNLCRVTSPYGTDIQFHLSPRRSLIGDGALTEDGEVDFFPGAQVSIAPVEETIDGVIAVDASDSVQGIVPTPYLMTLEKGVITKIEGGREADAMRSWLEARNDKAIYDLCHFTVGLNSQAGISGNMIEDERKLGAIDFGFGYQDPSFGGTVGHSLHHMDVMLAAPSVFLDGKSMSDEGRLNLDLGLVDV